MVVAGLSLVNRRGESFTDCLGLKNISKLPED